jgi:CDP-paratose 2-epimerase
VSFANLISSVNRTPLIRDRNGILGLLKILKPDAIVHTAAQPSHDHAANIPFDDFDVNAVGTLNML